MVIEQRKPTLGHAQQRGGLVLIDTAGQSATQQNVQTGRRFDLSNHIKPLPVQRAGTSICSPGPQTEAVLVPARSIRENFIMGCFKHGGTSKEQPWMFFKNCQNHQCFWGKMRFLGSNWFAINR
jgi:hypothetical protein